MCVCPHPPHRPSAVVVFLVMRLAFEAGTSLNSIILGYLLVPCLFCVVAGIVLWPGGKFLRGEEWRKEQARLNESQYAADGPVGDGVADEGVVAEEGEERGRVGGGRPPRSLSRMTSFYQNPEFSGIKEIVKTGEYWFFSVVMMFSIFRLAFYLGEWSGCASIVVVVVAIAGVG